MPIFHAYTNQVSNGTATSVVRPIDWNSNHVIQIPEAFRISGNTAGTTSAISTGTVVLAGGNNVTLSQNGNTINVIGANQSVQTQGTFNSTVLGSYQLTSNMSLYPQSTQLTAYQAVSGMSNYPQIQTNGYIQDAVVQDLGFLRDVAVENVCSGLVEGGAISVNSDPTKIDVSGGVGFVNDHSGAEGSYKKVTWGTFTAILPGSLGNVYVGIDKNGNIYVGNVKPSTLDHIYLGHIYVASNNNVIEVFNIPEWAGHFPARVNEFVAQGLGTLVSNGLSVTEEPEPLRLTTNTGSFYARLGKYTKDTPSSTFTKLFNTENFGWIPDMSGDYVNTTHWNNVNLNADVALVEMTAGYWKKDLVLMTPSLNVYYIYAQTEYSTEDAAKDGLIPSIPDTIKEDSVILAYIVCQKGDLSIASRLIDVRPSLERVFGYGSQGGGIVVDHGTLLGLADNDHPQYQLSTGMSNYVPVTATTSFMPSSNSTLFQATSATSAITANAFPTVNSTNLLGTGYTTHTHLYAATNITTNNIATSQSSLFQHTSATSSITSNAFPTANTTNLLGTGYSTHTHPYVFTSQSSLFQHTSGTSAITSNAFPSANTTLLLGSGYTTHTHPYIATSASSLLQATSATSAITSNAFPSANSSLLQATSATSAITANAFPSAQTTKFAGSGFSGTNVSGTVNSNGIQLSVLAGGGAGDGYNIIGVNGGATALSTTLQLNNANNVTFGLNAGTITASASFPTQTVQPAVAQLNGSSGTMSFVAANNITATSNASTVTFGLVTNYSTNWTNITSNAFNTSGSSNFVLTGNSSLFQHTTATSNITSNAFAASATTKFAGTGTSATNASITMNSNGLAISVAAPGAAAENNWFSLGGNVVGNSTASGSTIQLIGGNNITLSGTNGSQIQIVGAVGGGAGGFSQRWQQLPMIRFSLSNLTNVTAIQAVPVFMPFTNAGSLTVGRANFEMSRSTSGSNAFSVTMGIYTYVNDTQLSLLTSFSGGFSNSATASVSGIRRFAITPPGTFSLAPGGYVMGMMFSATASASMNYSIRGFSGAVQAGAILPGNDQYNTATSYNIFPFLGRLSATTAAFPSSVGDSQVRGQFSGASAPINAWIGLNAD